MDFRVAHILFEHPCDVFGNVMSVRNLPSPGHWMGRLLESENTESLSVVELQASFDWF